MRQVDQYQIELFLRRNGYTVDALSINAILRRLDHAGDEIVNFEEMVEAVRPGNRP